MDVYVGSTKLHLAYPDQRTKIIPVTLCGIPVASLGTTNQKWNNPYFREHNCKKCERSLDRIVKTGVVA